jgi:hypothetical protein
MREPALVRRSVRDHAEILKALLQKKSKLARGLLERNWRAGMEAVLTQVSEPKQATGQ